MVVRKLLTSHGIDILPITVDEILRSENVVGYWPLICDLAETDNSENLLIEIAKLWITIRGFSYAGNLIEQYMK